MSEQPPLFRRYPALAEVVPWLSLGRFPTPLEPLPLAAAGEAWIKRDDLSGGPYGGNKVRKLEFLLADAQRAGAGRLITAGALGSHHALATALYGRRLGLRVTLVLFPQPVTPHVRDVLLAAAAAGADFRFVPRMELVPGALLALRWATRSERGYVIPPGGSNALGTLGYVNAALELARLDSRVAATRITGRIVTNERALARLVRGTLALLQPVVQFDPDAAARRVEIRHRQIGGGYGRETPAARAATSLFEPLGLRLDPTYTAKAAAELVAAPGSGPRIFWHTLSAVEPPRAAGPEIEQALPPRIRELLDAA